MALFPFHKSSTSTSSSSSSSSSPTDSRPVMPPVPEQIIVTFDGKVRSVERFDSKRSEQEYEETKAQTERPQQRRRKSSSPERYYATQRDHEMVVDSVADMAEREVID